MTRVLEISTLIGITSQSCLEMGKKIKGIMDYQDYVDKTNFIE